MNKPPTPRAHGYIDYAVVFTLLLIPTALGFSQTPAVICYVLAAVHLTMTLLTAFPLGVRLTFVEEGPYLAPSRPSAV